MKNPFSDPTVTKTSFSCMRDGLMIRGLLYKPQGENLPIAIVSHGFMANYKTVLQYVKFLAHKGYAAFCFDFCGGCVLGGKSDGETTDMSVLTEVRDLHAVIQYARSLPCTDAESILLMGCSQGGFVSALTAAELQDSIQDLVLFYPAFCIPDDARNGSMMYAKFDPAHLPDTINCGPMKLGRRYAADVLAMDPYQEIAAYNGNVLIVHGTTDKIVNIRYAERAAAVYRERPHAGRTAYRTIENGAHGFSKKHDVIAMQYLQQFLENDPV